MAKKADRFPPLLIITGNEDLLRRRFLDSVVEERRAAGWAIEDVDGNSLAAVRDALDGGGMFIDVETLAVVHDPNKVSIDLLKEQAVSTDYVTTLLLYLEGEPDGRTKFGKFVKAHKAVHRGFKKPEKWDAPKVATTFVLDEVKSYGKTMTPAFAAALVGRAGSDLGILAFEIQKIVMLAGDSEVIEASHIAGGMSEVAEAAVGPILDALAVRDPKKLSRALAKVKRTSPRDPTIHICRFLGPTVIKWMQAVHLDHMPPKVAAAEIKMSPWYFENKILPAAERWGKKGTVRPIGDLAASERAMLNGAVSGWVVLTSRLLASCSLKGSSTPR